MDSGRIGPVGRGHQTRSRLGPGNARGSGGGGCTLIPPGIPASRTQYHSPHRILRPRAVTSTVPPAVCLSLPSRAPRHSTAGHPTELCIFFSIPCFWCFPGSTGIDFCASFPPSPSQDIELSPTPLNLRTQQRQRRMRPSPPGPARPDDQQTRLGGGVLGARKTRHRQREVPRKMEAWALLCA